ncbi:hypothetical protein H5410_015718 [Solanum commersonii]|uniref:Uncharacterized protein n=1 Tax=Solanum commersonii TaxID=4109 RepID=A0A9J5ZUF9_SOLCO|nr:hypothetical protein H5410_015718 [Solanum commersonii]
MKKLGRAYLDDLLWYNLDTWCKRYFQNYSNIFSNKILTSLCNATCLGIEKKVLILSTKVLHILWTLLVGVIVADLSSLRAFLVLMVFMPFITRSWNQSITINYVANCYSNETYLSTYAHFIEPMNNIKIWSTSTNPIVKSPKIKKMLGRPRLEEKKQMKA